MRALHLFALVLSAAQFAAPRAGAEPPTPSTISASAENVQRLQGRIAAGDKAAYPAELSELKAMAAVIAGAGTANWADRGESDSLVVYVLSGGALDPVVPLVKLDSIAPSERALVRGALAYVTNHEAEALEFLGPLDLSGLDARIVGQVAFARSVLKTRADPKGAMEDLDWARLAAPGGLVEEAALRRETVLLVEARDLARAVLLIRQYADRFAASLYAADFFSRLARLIGAAGLADDPSIFRRLSDAAARLPVEARRDFLLGLARAAAVSGRLEEAGAAAGEGLRLAAAGSAEEARGRLYLAAARVLADGADATTANLDAIAAARLDRSDAVLLAAVRNVGAQLRAPPSAAAGETASGAASDTDARDPTIERAEAALRRTDGLAAEAGSSGP